MDISYIMVRVLHVKKLSNTAENGGWNSGLGRRSGWIGRFLCLWYPNHNVLYITWLVDVCAYIFDLVTPMLSPELDFIMCSPSQPPILKVRFILFHYHIANYHIGTIFCDIFHNDAVRSYRMSRLVFKSLVFRPNFG